MKTRTPEQIVQRACLDLLRYHGWPVWRFNAGVLRNPAGRPVSFITGPDGRPYSGFSDIGALIPGSGRWLAVECKRPGGKPTPLQLAHLQVVNQAGGVGVLIDDVATLDDVMMELENDPQSRFTVEGQPLQS